MSTSYINQLPCTSDIIIYSATGVFYIKDIDEDLNASAHVNCVDVGVPVVALAHHSSLQDSVYVTCDPNYLHSAAQVGELKQTVTMLQWRDNAVCILRPNFTCQWC